MKYWAYTIQDIDSLQTHLPLLNEFSSNAAQKLAVEIDSNVLNYYVTQVDSDNAGATAGAISGAIDLGATTAPEGITQGSTSTAFQHVMDANIVLDEQNIEDTGRWMVAPAWFCSYLKAGDIRRADITGDSTGTIRTGLIGQVDRMTLIRNNNMAVGADTGGPGVAGEYWTMFGTKEANTFALQLTKSESLRIPDSFGEYVRGLSVFGREVVQPKALGRGVVTPA